MFTCCYGLKGGSGVTTVAASIALGAPGRLLVVDLAGDLVAALGAVVVGGPGVADWFRSDAPADHLLDLAVDIGRGTVVVPAGNGPPAADGRWGELREWLQARVAGGGDVVVDAGVVRAGAPGGLVALAAACHERLLVTRRCYLGLRLAPTAPVAPTGVVVVDEPGRSLAGPDIERSAGAPIVATVDWDARVARALDSGLLGTRDLPRPLRRLARRGSAGSVDAEVWA